jgi:hypothetical protein
VSPVTEETVTGLTWVSDNCHPSGLFVVKLPLRWTYMRLYGETIAS